MVWAKPPAGNVLSEAEAILGTWRSSTHNQYHLEDEGVGRRTIVIDTSFTSPLNFSISRQDQLFESGTVAGHAFPRRLALREQQA